MKNIVKQNFLVMLGLTASLSLCSQTMIPDLQDTANWSVFNRTAEPFTENGKKGIRFSEGEGNGLMILKGSVFTEGIIELDIKGSSKFQQSFVGVFFHGQDNNTYDAVYCRPFNFKSNEAIRRAHMVQYINMPKYDWEKLRTGFPGKYENGIDPAPGPDEWFHLKISVKGKRVSVFVNHQQKPSLEVDKISNNNKGTLGLWLGNNSAGSFSNLKFTPLR